MEYITAIKNLRKDIENKNRRIKEISDERDILRNFIIEMVESEAPQEVNWVAKAKKVLNKSFK